MEIKTDISLQTKQVLSQVQMQSLNILSMSMTELEEFLQNEEIENPLVEYSSGRQEGELPVAYREYDRFYNGASREGDSRGGIYEADDTEQSVEHMIMMQLPWKTLTEEQHRIVKFCIHSLDQNGYLTVPPSEIAEALKAEVSEVEYIVSRLKELEPVGIFASSLEECLVLQVLGMEQEAALCTIIRNLLQDVADGKVSTISRRLKLSSVEVRKLIHVIRNLNPRPLNGYGGDRAQYVFPDIILNYQDGQWTVSLNDKWAGNISINEFYVHMMETAQDEELKNYFEEKLKRARFIMNAVEQRRRTLEGITEGILKRQAGYFLGKEPLKPMTLEEIAAEREIQDYGFSTADEMLYPENYSYLSDVLSYIAIGARSVENQQHRLTSSGVDVPVGMKNPTGGDLGVMLNAVYAAQHGHDFIYRTMEVTTDGNPLAHTILRGAVSKHGQCIPNYHYEDLELLLQLYGERELVNPACIVDANHSNSNKRYEEQVRIVKEVLHSRRYSPDIHKFVKGVMIESYLEPGSQKIGEHIYGKSITDPCLGWEESERLLYDIAEEI